MVVGGAFWSPGGSFKVRCVRYFKVIQVPVFDALTICRFDLALGTLRVGWSMTMARSSMLTVALFGLERLILTELGLWFSRRIIWLNSRMLWKVRFTRKFLKFALSFYCSFSEMLHSKYLWPVVLTRIRAFRFLLGPARMRPHSAEAMLWTILG